MSKTPSDYLDVIADPAMAIALTHARTALHEHCSTELSLEHVIFSAIAGYAAAIGTLLVLLDDCAVPADEVLEAIVSQIRTSREEGRENPPPKVN